MGMPLRDKTIWVATKNNKDKVFRQCPDASERLTYDNVMPYVEKTELNITRAELRDARKEIERLRGNKK